MSTVNAIDLYGTALHRANNRIPVGKVERPTEFPDSIIRADFCDGRVAGIAAEAASGNGIRLALAADQGMTPHIAKFLLKGTPYNIIDSAIADGSVAQDKELSPSPSTGRGGGPTLYPASRYWRGTFRLPKLDGSNELEWIRLHEVGDGFDKFCRIIGDKNGIWTYRLEGDQKNCLHGTRLHKDDVCLVTPHAEHINGEWATLRTQFDSGRDSVLNHMLARALISQEHVVRTTENRGQIITLHEIENIHHTDTPLPLMYGAHPFADFPDLGSGEWKTTFNAKRVNLDSNKIPIHTSLYHDADTELPEFRFSEGVTINDFGYDHIFEIPDSSRDSNSYFWVSVFNEKTGVEVKFGMSGLFSKFKFFYVPKGDRQGILSVEPLTMMPNAAILKYKHRVEEAIPFEVGKGEKYVGASIMEVIHHNVSGIATSAPFPMPLGNYYNATFNNTTWNNVPTFAI